MRTWAVMVGVAALTLLGIGGRLPAADEKPVDLQVGAAAPAFEGKDDAGKPWKSADHIGKKVVVLYFFPGDFTPGCTRQAQNFRDAMNKLTDEGVEVVGVSGDAVRSHAMMSRRH